MEYERFIVSLYKRDEKTVQSGVFLYVEKNGAVSRVTIKNCPSQSGVLFVYFNKKCIQVSFSGNFTFNFNEEFSQQNDYLFYLCYGENRCVGQVGNIGDKKKVLAAIERQYQKIRNVTQLNGEIDKNEIVDNIIYKVFSRTSDLYFQLSKNQLAQLFATFKRCDDLENMIKFSKFIQSSDDYDKSYVGIVYKKNTPYAIAVGFCCDKFHFIADGRFKFLPFEDNQEEGIYLSFRRASDGDLI